MTDLEKLTSMVRKIRTAFERVANKRNHPSNLEGWCKDATSFIFKHARAAGIKVDIGHVPGHWFILLDDMVVDITSTQFGVANTVSILSLDEAMKIGWWWRLRRDGRISDPIEPWDASLAESVAKEMEYLL